MTTDLMGCVRRTELLFLLALVACSSSPPTNFYVLTSLADADSKVLTAGTLSETGPLLGIGPIDLPDYLDQPQIVTRAASVNALTLAELDRWAEPLQDGITRILAEDLSQLMPEARIAVFPWKRAVAADVQVIVRIARFEVSAGEALLAAEWQLVTGAEGDAVAYRSSFTEAVSGEGYSASVAAMSGALGQLSREIAAAIR